MVFYGEPATIEAAGNLKTMADEHSVQAKWFSIEELAGMNERGELRYDEPLFWAQYLAQGG